MACGALLGGCGASLDSGTPGAAASLSGPDRELASQSSVPLPREAKPLVSVSTPGSAAYKIGPQDVLEVSVFQVPDLSKTVQVADSGTVNLPLVGEIPAAARTAQDVERDLTKRLREKYLNNPQVTVFIREYNSQRVTLEGAVKTPGVYPMRGRTSLMQAIAMAGGLETNTSSSEVVVFRQVGDKRSAARFDISEIRAGRADDPYLQQGDIVLVDTSGTKLVFQNLLKILPVGGLFVGLL